MPEDWFEASCVVTYGVGLFDHLKIPHLPNVYGGDYGLLL